MTFEARGQQAPDYLPVRYGESRLMFRGPKRKIEDDYIVVLGGTETYGKFIETPYPEMLEKQVNKPVVNLGCLNAGIDAFVYDTTVLDLANEASAVVIQVMGAQNMSNRFYTVHPRRNDRFLNASALLKAIYRDVDFTEFHFTRHMLATLKEIDAMRFEMVREELKEAWTARMRLLLNSIDRPVLLLWFSDHKPPQSIGPDSTDPMFVDEEMLDAIAPATAGFLEVVPSQAALSEGVDRMAFDPMDRAAAEELLSAKAHEEASLRLGPALEAVLKPH